ncbi:MAG TPA: SgcJ/EcaC family oxidoreductase [Vicinamibacteria bacterium]|nr:SgcJ/EcaC family oxidoreductase [Vicinamibacteria bacterium]
MQKTIRISLAMALAVFVIAGCAPPAPTEAPDTRAADEATIRANVKEWSAAAQAKDSERFLSFYAEDATLMLEAAPDVSGRAALGEALAGMMQDPNFDLSFEAEDVVVARASDLAYETGSYRLTVSGPDGEPATQTGHYVVVWRKMPDGSWKVAVDAPVSDPPK